MRSFATSWLLATSALFSSVLSTPIVQRRGVNAGQLAVYYGQGGNQATLSNYCNDDTIDIIPLGFVSALPGNTGSVDGYPTLNFGNQCYAGGQWVDPQGHETGMFANCNSMIPSIQYCQSKGKKILLSIGGASQVYFQNDATAKSFAEFMWGSFGPYDSSWTGPRPFGKDIVLDGFDFDIETTSAPVAVDTGIAAAAKRFRELWGTNQRLLTAAPQCAVPDTHIQNVLNQVSFDALFVQFYNTKYCSARAAFDNTFAESGRTASFSFGAWDTWLTANSVNPVIKVFVGLPAATGAASDSRYYLSPTEVKTLLTSTTNKYPTRYGGVMLWEMTYSANNVNAQGQSYAQQIKVVMNNLGGVTTTTTTTTTTTSSSTTSSSTTSASTTSSSTTSSSTSTASTTSSSTTSSSTTSASTTSSSTTSSSTTSASTTSSSTTTSSTTSASTTTTSASTTTTTTTKSATAITTPTTTSSVSSTTTTTKAINPITTTSSSSASTTPSTTTSSSSKSTTTSSTSTSLSKVGPILTSTTSDTTTSKSTTSSSSTTTGKFSVGPNLSTTTSSTSTTTGKFSVGPNLSSTTTTTTTTGKFSVGPNLSSTTTTTTKKFSVDPNLTSTTSTTTKKFSFDPNLSSTTTSTREGTYTWTTKSSNPWDPLPTTKSADTWEPVPTPPKKPVNTWEPPPTPTSKKPIDPWAPAPIPTTTATYHYNDPSWQPVNPQVTITVITTSYVNICPTGYTTIPYTTTITYTITEKTPANHVTRPTATGSAYNNDQNTKPIYVWPTNSAGCPEGFFTTTTICNSGCNLPGEPAGPKTVTVTLPIPKGEITMTVQPVPVNTGAKNIPAAGSETWSVLAASTTKKPVAPAGETWSPVAGADTTTVSWKLSASTSTSPSAAKGTDDTWSSVKVYKGAANAEKFKLEGVLMMLVMGMSLVLAVLAI